MSIVTLASVKAARRLAGAVVDRLDHAALRLTLDQWLRENFNVRDDDVFVVSYPKSGTTWMQMLLYQLTTSGEINFDHIYKVAPWLALKVRAGTVMGFQETTASEIEARPAPRVLKTHLAYDLVPRWVKGRFILVTRDPLDVAASMLHQERSRVDANCTFDEVFDWMFRGVGSENWHEYTRQWMENKWSRPVLCVDYEEMKRDLEAVARRIIDFCDFAVDESDFVRILERSSFAFMSLHQEKFGPPPNEPRPKISSNFIRRGEVGEGRERASEEQKAFVRALMDRLPQRARVDRFARRR